MAVVPRNSVRCSPALADDPLLVLQPVPPPAMPLLLVLLLPPSSLPPPAMPLLLLLVLPAAPRRPLCVAPSRDVLDPPQDLPLRHELSLQVRRPHYRPVPRPLPLPLPVVGEGADPMVPLPLPLPVVGEGADPMVPALLPLPLCAPSPPPRARVPAPPLLRPPSPAPAPAVSSLPAAPSFSPPPREPPREPHLHSPSAAAAAAAVFPPPPPREPPREPHLHSPSAAAAAVFPPPPPLELAEELPPQPLGLPPQPLELFVQEPPLPMPPEETLQLLRVEVRHLQHLVRQNARQSHQTLVLPRVPLPLLLVPRRVQDDEILPPHHQFPLYRGRDQDAGEEQTLLVLVQEQREQEYRVSADASGETLGELVQLR